MPSMRASKSYVRERPLTPIKTPVKTRGVLIYDLESKRDLSQEEGFTRPFMVGFLDHTQVFKTFWDEPRDPQVHPDFRKHVLSDQGCIGKFCRHVLGSPSKSDYRPPPWTSDKYDLYAHNGGRFDVTYLICWLFEHRDEFQVRLVIVQGRVQRLDVSPAKEKPKKKNTVSFLDSSLILPMKLSEATRLFSKGETKEESFDRNKPEWDRDSWENYNRRDCVGLKDALKGFASMLELEGGELCMTAPASSMKLFRRRFLKKKIPRAMHFPGCKGECLGCDRKELCDSKCHGCLHAWIRKAYFGGRVEIFERFASAPCYYYDLNSSYPASMMELMPVGRPVKIQGNQDFWKEHETRRASNQLAFVEARVFIPSTCKIPPLPVLMDNKLKFPAGYFSGIWEYDELMQVLDPFVGGKILEVKKAIWFKGEYIFRDFVETLYKYKQAGSEAKAQCARENREPTWAEKAAIALGELAKLMLNSLYGKFAMDPEREEILFLTRNPGPLGAYKLPKDQLGAFGEPLGSKPLDGRHETCPVWLLPKFVSPNYLIPQWSARITSLSRATWWRCCRDVCLAGGKVFYGDCDAVISNIQLPESMTHATKLGFWKQEHVSKVLSGEFILPKHYMLCDDLGSKPIIHMKGVPRDFQTRDTWELLKSGGELRKENSRTSQPKTVLRGLVKEGADQGPLGIFMMDSVKKLRSIYDKRIVMDDGSTQPVFLEQEES